MSRDFNFYSVNDFIEMIESMNIKREITHIQVHHTWKPTLAGYKLAKDKEQVIRSMWHYHTVVHGWKDIAQHFTFVPDGAFDGRSMESNPAGIANFNKGGICVEIIGDFDIGREKLDGSYMYDVASMFATLANKWDVPFIFHNEKSTKTCPGSSIDKKDFLDTVNMHKVSLNYIKNKPSIEAAIAYLDYYKILNTDPKNNLKTWINVIKSNKDIPFNMVELLFINFMAANGKPKLSYEQAVKELGILGILSSPKYWIQRPESVSNTYIKTVIHRMASSMIRYSHVK